MESVIAEYPSLPAAEHAVRELERSGFSIQDFSVSDEARRTWRKSYPNWDRRNLERAARRGLIAGTAITLALALLAAYSVFLTVGSVWSWLGGASLLGGCVGSVLAVRRERKKPQAAGGFYVILRSDAATTDAVCARIRASTPQVPTQRLGVSGGDAGAAQRAAHAGALGS